MNTKAEAWLSRSVFNGWEWGIDFPHSKGDHYLLTDKNYTTKGSAKRGCERMATRLQLNLKWRKNE